MSGTSAEPTTTLPRPFAIPWAQLVAPTAAWTALRDKRAWWHAILAQWVLGYAGAVVSSLPLSQLVDVSGIQVSPPQQSILGFIAGAIVLAVSILLINAVFAGLLKLWLMLAGLQLPYIDSLTWVANGMIPFALGILMGQLVFAIVQPLPKDTAMALALLIKPYSAGLASVYPDRIQPLSYFWFLFSYLDLFAIWSIVVLAIGAKRFLGYSNRQTLWAMVALVLLWFLTLSAYWRSTQIWLVSASS